MKILHVIPSLSDLRGGPSASLRQLVAAQREAGLEARILTTNDDCEKNNDWPLGSWFEVDSVPVIAFKRRLSRWGWLQEHIVSLDALRWLQQNAADWDILHVHAVFSYLSSHSMRLARRLGRPYVCRPLGQLCHWSLQQKKIKKLIYLRLLERANLRHAARVHFTSTKERDEFLLLGCPAREMVVPHGIVLPDRPPERSVHRPLTILSMSRIDNKKGLDLLIRGFALALEQLPEATLVIAGDGDADCIAQLRHLAASLDASEQIRFTGWVRGEIKKDLLRQADLFALASHSENFGVAVVEALSFGVPALVTEGVALCDDVIAADAGQEISYDPANIAAAICALASDDARRLQLGRNARRLVEEHFSWPRIVANLSVHYQEIVDADAA